MKKTKSYIFLYLLWILAFWLFTFVTLNYWLKPYSMQYEQTGKLTVGYFAYAVIGMVFSTPAPFLSVLIIALFHEKVGLKTFRGRMIHTEKKLKATLLTAGYCFPALLLALLYGTPNGSPWYMLPLGFLVMIPFVGIAEEAGWRGFLQPELEKKMPFPFSVLVVAAIWDVWHIDLWFDPTSNHYGDSFIGFSINILVWAFALAALYRATKSVLACAVYHAFIDAIGAVYDWNALFDPFPGGISVNLYRILVLTCSVLLWLHAERQEKEALKSAQKNMEETICED